MLVQILTLLRSESGRQAENQGPWWLRRPRFSAPMKNATDHTDTQDAAFLENQDLQKLTTTINLDGANTTLRDLSMMGQWLTSL